MKQLTRRDLRKSLSELQSCSDTQRRGNQSFIPKFGPIGASPKTCQNIEGEPSKMDYRKHGSDRFKCGEPILPGSSYCPHHDKKFVIARTPLTAKAEPPA